MSNYLFTIFLVAIIFVGCNKELKESRKEAPTMQGQEKKDQHDHAKERPKSYYTCSMHPQIKLDKPGKCPICHMNLTKIEVEEEEEEETNQSTSLSSPQKGNSASAVIGTVKLRKSQLSHFKPEFFPATTMMMSKKIRLLGTVLQSEDKESNIPARIGGRVEKVYVKSTGSLITQGDPVVDLYSPQLITAGEEYLIARKSSESSKSNEFKDMLTQSEERLNQWGIRKFQYESWFKQGKVLRSITIYSPSTGIVRKRNAVVGKYFKEGQNFFELSDLSDVWVELDVYEHDAALVSIGQEVKMEFTSLPGEILTGEIDFIDPVLNAKSRTLKIRTTIKNHAGKLKPGMVANATLIVHLAGRPLVIPRTAIIDTGKRKVVWVKVTKNKFQAKSILTGHESEGYVEIKNGLVENEEVVLEGSFLLDAQAQLFGGYEDLNNDPSAKPKQQAAGHNH